MAQEISSNNRVKFDLPWAWRGIGTVKCKVICIHSDGQVRFSYNYGPALRSDMLSLLWRHNGRDGVSNHQPHDCLLNRLFRRRSNKTSKRRVTGLCAGNSPVTGEFPAQRQVTRKISPFDDVIMSKPVEIFQCVNFIRRRPTTPSHA